jgi:hypothetical protein
MSSEIKISGKPYEAERMISPTINDEKVFKRINPTKQIKVT